MIVLMSDEDDHDDDDAGDDADDDEDDEETDALVVLSMEMLGFLGKSAGGYYPGLLSNTGKAWCPHNPFRSQHSAACRVVATKSAK